MTEYPKDGSTFVTEDVVQTAYRWMKYKTDGARQMRKAGQWEKRVFRGDFFKWENCDEPTGQIVEHGGMMARLQADAAEIARLREALQWYAHNMALLQHPNDAGFISRKALRQDLGKIARLALGVEEEGDK